MKMRFKIQIVILILLLFPFIPAAVAAGAGVKTDNPKELGRVSWQKDLDKALKEAESTGKPVLLLFQQIPGCQTCQDFGQKPLTHPLLVEAIETGFIPLAAANNKPGKGAKILKRFREPAWNNPVMRFVEAAGKDILPRRDRIWKAGAVAGRLIEALEAAKRPVPGYLQVAAAELNARNPRKATFAMASFWDGEARLGAVDGVLATRAGWIDDLEVVEVLFDEETISYRDLIKESLKLECARTVFAHSEEQLRLAEEIVPGKAELIDRAARDASRFDRKYELKRTPYRYLPLTPMQATKANAALRLGTDATRFLSLRQLAMAKEIEAVLEADRNALSYLKPPEHDIWALSAYEDELRSKLEVLPKASPGKNKRK